MFYQNRRLKEEDVKMKILAIVGSLRKNSYNRQLAKEAGKILNDMNIEFEILEYSDLPLFNEDIEYPELKSVKRVREKVDLADGIWFFTPEYNRSYSGVLKNLIDWLSRQREGKPALLKNKAVAISGMTRGMTGTLLSQYNLVSLLSQLNMNIMNSPRLTIPNAKEQIDENDKVKLTKSYKYLERQAISFVDFVNKSNT
ncbi:MAG: NADPH-dependent FMN reductase [Peptoniphilaceae bacterium]